MKVFKEKVKIDYINIYSLEDENEEEIVYENERILKGDNLYKNEQEEIMKKLILEEIIETLPQDDKEYVNYLLEGYSIAEIGKIKGYDFKESRKIYTNIIQKLQIRYRGMQKKGRRPKR